MSLVITYIIIESENSCSGPVSSVRAPDFEEDLRQSLTAGMAESLTSAHPLPCDLKYQKLMPMENSSTGVLGEV